MQNQNMNAGLDHWRIKGFFQLSSILAKCKRNSYGSGKIKCICNTNVWSAKNNYC
jgi:hypothetical protein